MSAIFNNKVRPLSAREREHVRNRLRQSEQSLAGKIVVPGNKRIGSEGLDPRRQGHYEEFLRTDIQEDQGLLRAKIERDKKLLAQGEPSSMTRKERDAIAKQVVKDREYIQKIMCPKPLFNLKESDPDFQKAVAACRREHTVQYQKVAGRLKENMRRIDPDADSNLEKLRPNS